MLPQSLDSEQLCLVTTLVSATMGLVAGVMNWTDTRGTRLSTVMAARYLPEDTPSNVPRLPRGVFLSLLFMAVPLVKGWCTLLPGRSFFAGVLGGVCASAGVWLLAASALDSAVAAERKEHIEQFIASEPGNEPHSEPPFESFPHWLRVWEGINLAGYASMIAALFYSLFALSRP